MNSDNLAELVFYGLYPQHRLPRMSKANFDMTVAYRNAIENMPSDSLQEEVERAFKFLVYYKGVDMFIGGDYVATKKLLVENAVLRLKLQLN